MLACLLAYLLTYCLARDDPSPLPWRTLSAQMGSRANAQYNWRGVEGREARAKALPIADPNPNPNPNPNQVTAGMQQVQQVQAIC